MARFKYCKKHKINYNKYCSQCTQEEADAHWCQIHNTYHCLICATVAKAFGSAPVTLDMAKRRLKKALRKY